MLSHPGRLYNTGFGLDAQNIKIHRSGSWAKTTIPTVTTEELMDHLTPCSVTHKVIHPWLQLSLLWNAMKNMFDPPHTLCMQSGIWHFLPDMSSAPGAAGAAAAATAAVASPPVDSGRSIPKKIPNRTVPGQSRFSHSHRSIGAKKG